MTVQELFNIRNTRLFKEKVYEVCRGRDPVWKSKNIPYTAASFRNELERMNIYRGCEESLNEMFEEKSNTMPFNIIWDMYMFYYGKIPDIDGFVAQYIKTYCDTIAEDIYTYKPQYKQADFNIRYDDLRTRIYKIYFSFAREYHLYLCLMEEGLNVFIDRREDYINRIDIGVIKDGVLYILDTSLDSQRSNRFEKRKMLTRRNLDASSEFLRNKFKCSWYVRIPLKACRFSDNPMFNTQKAGKFDLYANWYIEALVSFIQNQDIKENLSLSEDYFFRKGGV